MQDKVKLLILAIIIVIFAALFIGIGLTADNYQYFLSRRVPKVLAIIFAGIAIGLSALAFQTMTNNRILTPSIMGFDALYLLTQSLLVVGFGGASSVIVNKYLNFGLSLSVMLVFSILLFTLYFKKERTNIIALLLLGVILGQLFSNLSSFLIMLMDPNDFAVLEARMFASFNNIQVELVYLCGPVLLLVSGLLFRLHRQLDVMWLDHDNAISLGINVKRLRIVVLMLSVMLIAISTALIGPIMFLGILVTNLTREFLASYRHSTLFVGVSLITVVSLLGGQWVVENVFDFSTTLSVVVNFVGGIYFLRMLLRNRLI